MFYKLFQLPYFCVMQNIEFYQKQFLAYLENFSSFRDPKNLYTPIDYILRLGGKRLRPTLTLMAADIFSGTYKQALPAALAIEMFHNFTLVHDDIMDGAPVRRGKATVHKKWNINTGILSGDAMLILAYQYFENYKPITFQKLAKLFSKTALEVCNGQQLDVDFEIVSFPQPFDFTLLFSLSLSLLLDFFSLDLLLELDFSSMASWEIDTDT